MVQRGPNQGIRLADAVILPDEPHQRASFKDYPDLTSRNVVVVQTKATRLGMYAMGQGVFSKELVKKLGAKSVRSIILVTKSDAALLPLLEGHESIEVWIADRELRQTPRRIFP